MCDNLANALEVGRKVTAKVQWLSSAGPTRKMCWIHCTPLLGANDTVGVWMIILVNAENDDDENDKPAAPLQSYDNQLNSTYNAAAIPWDTDRHARKAMRDCGGSSSERNLNQNGVSMRPEPNGKGETLKRNEDTGSALPSAAAHSKANPGILGLTGRLGENRPVASSKECRLGSNNTRPNSQDSCISPTRTQLQPKTNLPGHASDGDSSRKAPIKLPGHCTTDVETGAGRTQVRRTYKSLSPYGVLFHD